MQVNKHHIKILLREILWAEHMPTRLSDFLTYLVDNYPTVVFDAFVDYRGPLLPEEAALEFIANQAEPNKIKAIRFYRNSCMDAGMDCDLKQAKDWVEQQAPYIQDLDIPF